MSEPTEAEQINEEWNGRACPYFARWYSLPGHDPDAVCMGGCVSEPSCITDQPTGGWPALVADPDGTAFEAFKEAVKRDG